MSRILIVILVIIIIWILINPGVVSEHYSDSNNINIDDDVGIYAINLKKRYQKRENIKNQFVKQNLYGNIFDAINGEELKLDELEKHGVLDSQRSKQLKKRLLRRGEIGCSMSHVTLWNMFKASDKKYFLILEDDALLTNNFKDKLTDLLNELKNTKWDVLYLNENCLKHFGKKACDGPSYTENTIRPNNVGYGLYGYIISRECVQKCDDVLPFIEPIDNYVIEKSFADRDFIVLRSKNVLVDLDKSFVSDTNPVS